MTGEKTIQWAAYTERIEQLPCVALRSIIKDAWEANAATPGGSQADFHAREIQICRLELSNRARRRYGFREYQYREVLTQMYLILKEAGYDSNEMVDDLRDLVNDSRRPAGADDE